MNILYLCDEYPPCQHGGIGTVTQTLARAIVKKGHRVVIAGFYPYYREASERENDQGVEVYRFFYGNKWKLKLSKHLLTGRFVNIRRMFEQYINKLNSLVEEYKIDIIESPDFVEAFRYSGPQMIQYTNFSVPFVVKLHGSYFVIYDYTNTKFGNSNIFAKEKTLLNFANGLVAVSANVKERVEKKFEIEKEIEILYNGISIDDSMLNKINLIENCVVFAGTLCENKGIFNLIKAWGKVIEIIPSARLLVFGEGSAATIQTIYQLITDRTKGSIELKGFVKKEDLIAFYSSASCAIFPSYAETFGIAPIEAMAVGCPTIFTKRTSGPEIINNGIDGLLVDPDNIMEISDAIIIMLTNRQLAIKMGQNAIRKVQDNFDVNIVADKHIEYYKHIIKN